MSRRYRTHIVRYLAAAALTLGGPRDGMAQVLRLTELNTHRIAELQRDSTVVIMPFGILEQHGPYLPSYADGFGAERLTQEAADTLASLGWTVIIFPTIPLGHGGANVIGGRHVFPGSYTVRAATLRAVALDLLSELGEQRFLNVVAISLHGAPDNNRALTQAGQYFADEFDGRMLNLFEYVFLNDIDATVFPESALAANGFSVHAGLRETSEMMYLRPDLVPKDVSGAPPVRGENMADLVRLAQSAAWPGYFGSPALASASFGERTYRAFAVLSITTIVRFLSGGPLPGPRYSEVAASDSTNIAIDAGSRRRDAAMAARQQRWLRRNAIVP